jgi:hypothetical protein
MASKALAVRGKFRGRVRELRGSFAVAAGGNRFRINRDKAGVIEPAGYGVHRSEFGRWLKDVRRFAWCVPTREILTVEDIFCAGVIAVAEQAKNSAFTLGQ